MADTVLKFAPSAPADIKTRASGWAAMLRARGRMILLVVVPLIALVGGLGFYLAGGRYVSTDNAYVGAQKVLITPDVSGKIDKIAVREGQHLAAGDALLEIYPEPYPLALAKAQAKLAAVRTDFSKLKTDLGTLTGLAEIARKNVELKQRDVDRKNALVASRTGSPADLDTSMGTLMTAQLQAKLAEQQHGDTLNALIGNPAAAKRQRQLGEGGAAGAGPHRLRPGRGRERATLRHERDGRYRHRPPALVRDAARPAGERQERLTMSAATSERSATFTRAMLTVCAMSATVMQTIDTTIANVALPYMQ